MISAEAIALHGPVDLTDTRRTWSCGRTGRSPSPAGTLSVADVFGATSGAGGDFSLTSIGNAIGESAGSPRPTATSCWSTGQPDAGRRFVGNNVFVEVAVAGGALRSARPTGLQRRCWRRRAVGLAGGQPGRRRRRHPVTATGGTVELSPFSAINASLFGATGWVVDAGCCRTWRRGADRRRLYRRAGRGDVPRRARAIRVDRRRRRPGRDGDDAAAARERRDHRAGRATDGRHADRQRRQRQPAERRSNAIGTLRRAHRDGRQRGRWRTARRSRSTARSPRPATCIWQRRTPAASPSARPAAWGPPRRDWSASPPRRCRSPRAVRRRRHVRVRAGGPGATVLLGPGGSLVSLAGITTNGCGSAR